MYSFVSAVGAALLAAAAGYGFAKFDFRGKNLLFWFVLGSVMVPTTALAIPTYLMFSESGSRTTRCRSSCRRWSARSGST